jgi:hypothetical protein
MNTSCLSNTLDWLIYADYLDDQNINHFIREDLQNEEEIPWDYEYRITGFAGVGGVGSVGSVGGVGIAVVGVVGVGGFAGVGFGDVSGVGGFGDVSGVGVGSDSFGE